MTLFGCSPEALITAVTALIVAITALVRQFQHQQSVDKQINGGTGEAAPPGPGKPGP